jgi:quercetin dioxygenase-like cupin family protein
MGGEALSRIAARGTTLHSQIVFERSRQMKHIHYLDEKPEPVDADGAKGLVIRHVITEKDGAPHFNLRVLSIEAGGQSPDHSHEWEHEFFVLSGKGIGVVDHRETPVKPGDAIFVPGGVQHCMRATEPLEVI